MRAWRDLLLLGVLALATLFAFAPRRREPDAEHRALSDRVMASKGFIPPGAPLQPPPRPAPREGFSSVDFALLSGFDFEAEGGALPREVAALADRPVELIGVMYFSVEDPDHVRGFFLMPDHTVCCFGTPRVNQIVEVLLPEGQETVYLLDYYLIRGVLRIGPFYDEHGLPLCLYRIVDAEVEVLG